MTSIWLKGMLPAAAALIVAVSPTPAFAVITTFASFSPLNSSSNVRWDNNSGSANGTGGSIFSLPVASSSVPGSRLVSFSFLQPELAPIVNNVTASFFLNASVPSENPAQSFGGFLVQNSIAGSFSFFSTAPITIGGTFYAPGSNLLSGTFSDAAIAGQRNGSSGSFSGSTFAGGSLNYTSDFLNFTNTVNSDFSISLTSITSLLQAAPTNGVPNRALRDFRAVAGGTFSTEPAPLISAVPEPSTWFMMLLGFGAVGAAIRRRRVIGQVEFA